MLEFLSLGLGRFFCNSHKDWSLEAEQIIAIWYSSFVFLEYMHMYSLRCSGTHSPLCYRVTYKSHVHDLMSGCLGVSFVAHWQKNSSPVAMTVQIWSFLSVLRTRSQAFKSCPTSKRVSEHTLKSTLKVVLKESRMCTSVHWPGKSFNVHPERGGTIKSGPDM